MTGPVTADGCPVEVYRRLPALGEPELVSRLAGPGASVLDLGAGCGRIADPMAERAHRVVAVDNSPEMLALVRRARPRLGEIAGLRLGERFDAVLLASHLVNVPSAATRQALLETAARHLAPDGRLIVQWHPPSWFDGLTAGRSYTGTIGPFTSTFEVRATDGDLLTAAVSYSDGEQSWSQEFTARRLSLDDLAAALAEVGLRLEPPDEDRPDWRTARPSRPTAAAAGGR